MDILMFYKQVSEVAGYGDQELYAQRIRNILL